jgi:hypothetical protein
MLAPVPSSEEPDVEVRRVDQAMINEFGRLASRKVEATEELDAAIVRRPAEDTVGASPHRGALRIRSL